MTRQVLLALALLFFLPGVLLAEDDPIEDDFEFDDSPLEDAVDHPDWFKLSFLNLPEDLEEAVEDDKKGLIVYFGQKHCPYCKAMMERDFGREDIATYTQRHFDVVPIDIWSDRMVTDMQGNLLPEKDFSVREKTNFTPSLIFYDADGKEALRLRGFYPPYKFLAALHYVAEGHYLAEAFHDYLDRGASAMHFDESTLNDSPLFLPGPVALARNELYGERPLAVFFEQPLCHACDVLHATSLNDEQIQDMLSQMDLAQVDKSSETPVLTPAGERTTASQWARELGLIYAPTLVFFDEWGDEILRVDSVVQFNRLRSVLRYVLEEAYLHEPNFQRWRQLQKDVPGS